MEVQKVGGREGGRRKEKEDIGVISHFLLSDEYITMKQVAAMRFHRNHRLMAEIFSDVVVPDMRTGQQHNVIVTSFMSCE